MLGCQCRMPRVSARRGVRTVRCILIIFRVSVLPVVVIEAPLASIRPLRILPMVASQGY